MNNALHDHWSLDVCDSYILKDATLSIFADSEHNFSTGASGNGGLHSFTLEESPYFECYVAEICNEEFLMFW